MKKLAGLCLALTLALAGCASGTQTSSSTSPTGAEIKVTSCGKEIVLKKTPEKVLMMNSIDASILFGLGVMDKVKLHAGNIRDGLSPEEKAKLEAVPTLKGEKLNTGGTKLSKEVVIEAKPDLIIGYPEAVDDPEGLQKAGIPLYIPPAFCENYSVDKASFDLVKDEINTMGKIFNANDKAKQLNTEVDNKVKELAKPNGEKKTSISLYLEPGSPEIYTYGRSSMVQPIVEANGLSNMYSDNSKRVFDVSLEDLLKKNPDYVILLYGTGTAEEAKKAFFSFKGVDKMKAVQENHVVVMSFALTDPPSLLSVKGATELAKLLKG